MTRQNAAILLVLCAMLVTPRASDSADKQPDRTAGAIDRLNAFVGTWKVTLKGNADASTTSEVEWILGGRFLRDEYTTHDGKQGLILRTYDEHSQEYRVWTFTEDGSQYQSGQWNSETNELKVVGQRGNGKVVTIATVKDDNTIEWAIGVVDAEGKTIEYYEGLNSRVTK